MVSILVIYVLFFSRGIADVLNTLWEPVNEEVQIDESLINGQCDV